MALLRWKNTAAIIPNAMSRPIITPAIIPPSFAEKEAAQNQQRRHVSDCRLSSMVQEEGEEENGGRDMKGEREKGTESGGTFALAKSTDLRT